MSKASIVVASVMQQSEQRIPQSRTEYRKKNWKVMPTIQRQYQYNIVSYCPSPTWWPSKTRCFDVFVCQLGALVGRDQARVEVITSS